MDYYQKKERFIERSRTVISNCDENLIAQAWDFSKQAHIDQRRKSNEPYFSHPVGVANILLSMDCDSETIAAALLHDVVEDTDIKLEEIRQKFGNDVANLVDGVTKLTPLDRPPQKIWQSEDVRRANIRKLMLSIADDPRVALIKLADRIHNLTTLGALPEDKRFRIASETLSVFAPIAEALGLENFRSRLQELAFQHLEPEIYLEIKKSIEEKGPEFDEVRRIALERIRAELERNNITAETYSRRKEIYSIYNKMLQLKSDFDEVYDIIGIRVVVNSIEDCYRVKFVIDQMGQEVKYDDYIWRPRQPLGYQSIHKVILDSGSQALIEVQIRTEEMHKQAERGSASHWIYKLGKSADSVLMERVSYLRSALESLSEALLNIEEDDTTENVIEQLNVDGLAPRIHVYSPQGDIISLPIGATPIDFAYHIHTDLGHECIGAKVNGIYVSLNHELKDGDSVSIFRRKGSTPKLRWILEGKVKSSAAQHKIRQYFRDQQRPQLINQGKTLIQKKLRNLADLNVSVHDIFLKISKSGVLQDQTEDSLYIAVAEGRIRLPYLNKLIGEIIVNRCFSDNGIASERFKETRSGLLRFLKERGMIGKSREDILYDSIVNRKLSVQEFISILQDFLQQKDSISSRSIVDKSPSVAEKPPSNQQRLLVIIPQCCYPIPGDEVVGYVTSGRGISVHRSVCPNILGSLKKEKVLPMSWSDPELSTVNIHSGEIIVTLIDEYRSVNQKIQEIVVKSKGVIRELVSIVSSRKITQLRIIVDVKDRQHLKTIQERISSINDVYDVHRSCED